MLHCLLSYWLVAQLSLKHVMPTGKMLQEASIPKSIRTRPFDGHQRCNAGNSQSSDGMKSRSQRNKKPGREEANPRAGFLDINLVSLAGLAIGDPISVRSRLPT
jgi:hypothetical protein